MSRLFSGTPFERPAICEHCGRAPADCQCITTKVILPEKKKMADRPGGKHHGTPQPAYQLTPANSTPPADQLVKIRVERRKGNREVTLITGLDHPGNDLPALLTALKSTLGCGGAVQGRTLELQGDQAARALAALEARGLRARCQK